MFVFVLLLLCIGHFINGDHTFGVEVDANLTACHDKERQTLLDINSNLDVWRGKESKDCCQWMGVTCDKYTGHVTQLELYDSSKYSLSGNIIHLLSLLPQLQFLILSKIDNQFHPIPNTLSSLSNLRSLKISGANLSGPIPHQLASFSNLMYLDLSNNSLSGPIPAFLGYMTSLIRLDLSKNRLEGVIPKSFKNLLHLVELDLSENLLKGSVPHFAGCSFMKEAISNSSYMYDGRYMSVLYSPVPDSPGCPSLHKLDLSRNWLTGNLPGSVGKLLNLEYLDVSSISLEGVISDVHFLNLTKLSYLDLSFNPFALNLSSNIRIKFQLRTIKMQSCKLGPSFPMWIQTQRSFAYLDISNAGISDHVPGWFWDLPRRLKFLNISSNEIKGTLPDITSTFEYHPGLDLSNNQLEGMISLSTPKLATLNLSGNRFSGKLSFLCRIDNALTFLDLSNNLLSGSLPDCWQRFREKLMVLNLSNNSLSGEVPSSLGFLSQLQALYLRKNAFVGEVPKSLSNCIKLRFVDLGENKLSGNVPAWIGETLSKLRVLVLRSNRLDGSLPAQLCYLNNLQFFDLSNNALFGNIPRCFGNFKAMARRGFQDANMNHYYYSYMLGGPTQDFDLRRCYAFSSQYKIYCHDDKAVFIDNALVAWKGTRREFERGLYLVKSIDISSNKLYGKIPNEITNLRELVSLNFSNNKLHGEVPKHMGRLKSLESLDLSRNEFSGNIPLSFSQLTLLSYLNLSKNKLSGRIPTGTQLQSFNNASYIGNSQLCGPPLAQRCGPPSPPATVVETKNVEEDGDEFWKSYYMGMGVGFVVGFWGICGTLLPV
ncbi:receptor-like protein EIX1 [Bidens hawaiensis]|uniref:receptor-like protein EIX1 n=1 Tax=Bidens hawaiensis TaxID=980011 RepID=UPI004049D0D4